MFLAFEQKKLNHRKFPIRHYHGKEETKKTQDITANKDKELHKKGQQAIGNPFTLNIYFQIATPQEWDYWSLQLRCSQSKNLHTNRIEDNRLCSIQKT